MAETGTENQTGLFNVVNFENADGECLAFTMRVMTEKGEDTNAEPDNSVLVCISTKDDDDGVGISVPVEVLATMLKRLLGDF